ncbi:MAG: DUF3267 domain-containing protein [Erysipelotrichaceae bacterium]|nr:DUF3267 domain-containing protein [Erysipelotrichaceae bacterium]
MYEDKRKLSAAEQRRAEAFEALAAKLEEEGYTRKEKTVGIVKANVISLVAMIPVFAIGFFLFFHINAPSSIDFNGLFLLVAMLVLVVVHELLHGITWSLFTENHWKDIEFGFMKELLTPYCTCRVPLKKPAYLAGSLMPLIVLGIIPFFVSLFNGSFNLLMISLVMILAATGDIIIVIMMLAHKSDAGEVIFLDHPYKAGFVVFEK